MPQRIIHLLQTDTAEALGYTFTGVSITTVIAEWLGHFELNEVLKAIMFAGTILFTLFKAYKTYLEAKGKRIENKIKKHELRKLDNEERNRKHK